MSIKAIKIQETFEDFLEEHPELRVETDSEGNIKKVLFPSEAKDVSYTNVYGEISLYYTYKGESIKFPTI